MNRSFRISVPAACIAWICGIQYSHATDETSLSGLWMETANYPASSVIRFEQSGSDIIGKYAQVSAPQRLWGFSVGEIVIRGRLEGQYFKGEVLLKQSAISKKPCKNIPTGWTPINMKLMESGKLYGAWLQTLTDEGTCEIRYRSWQPYGLERLELNQ